MTTQMRDLFLLEDLEDIGRTSDLAERDRDALRAVAEWIKTFIVRPHDELGRPGSVCPFVPGSVERQTLWLAPEQIGDGGVPHVVELMNGYKRRLLARGAGPTDGDGTNYNVIVVVLMDLPAERAEGVLDDVLQQIAVPSYVEDGIVFGPFYVGNQALRSTTRVFVHFSRPCRSCS